MTGGLPTQQQSGRNFHLQKEVRTAQRSNRYEGAIKLREDFRGLLQHLGALTFPKKEHVDCQHDLQTRPAAGSGDFRADFALRRIGPRCHPRGDRAHFYYVLAQALPPRAGVTRPLVALPAQGMEEGI